MQQFKNFNFTKFYQNMNKNKYVLGSEKGIGQFDF